MKPDTPQRKKPRGVYCTVGLSLSLFPPSSTQKQREVPLSIVANGKRKEERETTAFTLATKKGKKKLAVFPGSSAATNHTLVSLCGRREEALRGKERERWHDSSSSFPRPPFRLLPSSFSLGQRYPETVSESPHARRGREGGGGDFSFLSAWIVWQKIFLGWGRRADGQKREIRPRKKKRRKGLFQCLVEVGGMQAPPVGLVEVG